jgi:hypothetical protein
MKKFLSILIAVVLMLSMVAFAEGTVSSKTTTDLITVATTTDADGNPIDPVVTPGKDTMMGNEELEKIIEHVSEGNSAVSYFDEDTQKGILETVGDDTLTLEDLANWNINEFFSVDVSDYSGEGDVIVGMELVTPFEIGQKIVALLGTYDGTRTEVADNEFAFNVNWMPLKAEVVDNVTDPDTGDTKSIVEITYTAEAIKAMQESVANVMAILSEPTEPAAAE